MFFMCLWRCKTRYAIWNNKGGVGKTFLTFVLATEYARKNPDKHVIVVDMCPQADVSEVLLGGSRDGADNLQRLISQRRTVGGYFDERLRFPHDKTGREASFSVNVCNYNKDIPQNVSLVAGDPLLELQVQTIDKIAAQKLPKDSWKNVHSWVVDLERCISSAFPHSALVLIDCNPSFSSYTEQAVLAVERLIIPCSPDSSSARAIKNVSKLPYGHKVPKAYQGIIFSDKVRENSMSSPKIHRVLLSRINISNNRPLGAFEAVKNQLKDEIKELWDKDSEHKIFSAPLKSLFQNMPNAHIVATVATHTGAPLGGLRPGPYRVKDTLTQIRAEPLRRYRDAVENIVETLDIRDS